MSAPAERTSGSTNGHPRHAFGAGQGPIACAAAARGNGTCLRDLGGGVRIVTGHAGDHPLVLQLLVETRHAALGEDFQSRLDEPSYRPGNRLLVRRDRDLAAHVHVAGHIAWFEGQRVPVVRLEDFAARPEFARADYAAELLRQAELIATAEGAVLATAWTEEPETFVAQGWSLMRGQGHTRADARGVLAHLDAQEAARRRRRKHGLAVRTWRHFELDAIREVYDGAAAELWGPIVRSEAAWQWLIGRKAQDQILLAVQEEGGNGAAATCDAANGVATRDRVAGYAAVRGSCIMEMMTRENGAAARVPLLSRACRDAIDRGHHSIALYTPAADPLHELLVTAGGAWVSDSASPGRARGVLKLLAPERWVERLFSAWHERARSGGVERPLELGVAAGDERFRFTLTRRSSRWERARELPEHSIACDRPTLDSLLTGNLSATAALARGLVHVSHAELRAPLTAVFPARLFWQSPLELMRL